jgi:hypothetical protein
MKKILMSLLFVAFGATSVMAQGSFYLKPMVGGTLSTLTDADDAKFKFGIVGGAELGYQAAEQVDLTAGVLVAMQGAKTGEEILIKDASTTLTYLNVPVLVNYYIVPGLAIKAGVQPGFLLSQKTKVNFTDGTSEENTSTDHTKKFDLSIPLGLSYEFSDFVIDARYNLGVTKVNDNDSDMSSKNSVIMLTVGYKIPF